MAEDERILAGPWLVFTFLGGALQRLADRLTHPSRSYGYLIVTSRRVVYLRQFPSGKIRETETALLFSGSLRSEGWDSYRPSDLAQDVENPANLSIPLTTLRSVRTIGKDGATLELEVGGRAPRRLRFYKLGHVQRSLWFATPIPSREPMSDIAAAILDARRTSAP